MVLAQKRIQFLEYRGRKGKKSNLIKTIINTESQHELYRRLKFLSKKKHDNLSTTLIQVTLTDGWKVKLQKNRS